MSPDASPRPFVLRPILPSDVDAYVALRRRMLEEHPEAFLERPFEFEAGAREKTLQRIGVDPFDETRGIVGGFAGGRLVGAAGWAQETGPARRHIGVVWGMYVAPEARRAGMGRALLEAAVGRLRALEGVRQVHLSVMAPNTAARALYDAMGFRVYGVEPRAMIVNGVALDEEHRWLDLGA